MPDDPRPTRDPAARRQDHAEIDRLADELLPTLIGRLAATGLGEVEVREDAWRIRLRRPASPSRPSPRESSEARETRGRHERRETSESRESRDVRDVREQSGARPPGGDGNGTGPAIGGAGRSVATSPAVGVFEPGTALRIGARVRAGDRLGAVDLLGVPQEVLAPDDGIVLETVVAAGEGVEYGQDLVVIEPTGRGARAAGESSGGAAPPDSPAAEPA